MSAQIAGSPGQRRSRPATLPASRLGAQRGAMVARAAPEASSIVAHRTIPSIAAAEISASLTPGAQAMSGLPLVSPSPLRKSLT